MPAKRRTAKRRLDAATEARAWSTLFQCGHDYFDDLPTIGVESPRPYLPDRAIIEEAWHRLGARFLADRDPREIMTPWALEEFGEPGHAR